MFSGKGSRILNMRHVNISVHVIKNFRFEIIGHRGCEGLAPENSIAAMQTAIQLGIDRVEFDIQATRDGELVIFHDDVVQDHGLQKNVFTLTHAELLQIEEKTQEEIPTLDSVLELCRGKIKIQAELKGDGIASDVWVCIETSGIPIADVNISSFNLDRLVQFKSIAPAFDNVQLVLLLGKKLDVKPALDEMEEFGIGSISIFAQIVTRQNVEQVHERGFRAIAWGLGDKGLQPDKIITRYQLLLSKGVDGFTCAYHDILQGLIRETHHQT
jgi:glycerophosphoryl diester phosphodiesterase